MKSVSLATHPINLIGCKIALLPIQRLPASRLCALNTSTLHGIMKLSRYKYIHALKSENTSKYKSVDLDEILDTHAMPGLH